MRGSIWVFISKGKWDIGRCSDDRSKMNKWKTITHLWNGWQRSKLTECSWCLFFFSLSLSLSRFRKYCFCYFSLLFWSSKLTSIVLFSFSSSRKRKRYIGDLWGDSQGDLSAEILQFQGPTSFGDSSICCDRFFALNIVSSVSSVSSVEEDKKKPERNFIIFIICEIYIFKLWLCKDYRVLELSPPRIIAYSRRIIANIAANKRKEFERSKR